MEDEGGVLGNLPRSRPGRRSQKRGSGKTARRAAGGRTADTSSRAAAGAERRQAKAAQGPAAEAPTGGAGAPPAGDPMVDAVRLVAKVPVLGVRVAAGVTREVLRRLPRP